MNYQMAFEMGVWAFVVFAGFAVCFIGGICVLGIISSIFRMIGGGKNESDT